MLILPQVDKENKCVISFNGHFHLSYIKTVHLLNVLKEKYDTMENFGFLWAPTGDLIAKEFYISKKGDILDPIIAGESPPQLDLKRKIFERFCDIFAPDSERVIMDKVEHYNFLNGDNLILDHHRYDLYQGILKLFMESPDLQGYRDFFNNTASIIIPNENVRPTTDKILDTIYESNNVYSPYKNFTNKQVLDLLTEEDKQKILDVHSKFFDFKEEDIKPYFDPSNL